MVGYMGIVMGILLATQLLFAVVSAIPAVVFPFNSQVPTAARVNQPYVFQFSASTFVPGDASLVYSLSNQPAWLSIDSGSRTLTGTPGQSDTGSATFTLTAADGTGAAHMQCTLVIATDPLPTLQGDLGDQLAEATNLSSRDPAVMTLLPNSAFSFHFQQNSFIDIVQRTLYYYATLSDHTPLPAWLHFDPENLAFSGVAPLLSAFPQSFQIMLIASDVPGFAGTSAAFTINIGERQLVFVPEERDVRFRPGEVVNLGDLEEALFLNGANFDITKLKSADVEGLPDWLKFDSKNLKFDGNAPENAKTSNVTVKVSDDKGDTAMVVLHLIPQDSEELTLFTGTIGTLEATPGKHFEYTLPTAVIGDADATLMLILPTDAQWLSFDSKKRALSGDVPTQSFPLITATLNARAPNIPEPEMQVFNIKAIATTSSFVTTSITSSTAPTESTTSPVAAIAAETRSHNGLSRGTIAGISIGAVLAAIVLFVLLFLFCRRRRSREGYERHSSPSKRTISRPIPPIHANSIAVTTDLQRDVEKAGSVDRAPSEASERPPQIALNLPRNSARGSRWTNRFSRASLASSIGDGEDMVRADVNIPEWGHESAALQRPHDSFSVPAQMARISRQPSDISPSKGALQRLRTKRAKHRSENSIGLGIGIVGSSLMPSRAESRRKANSLGFEATLNRSSCASSATQDTGVLSVRHSDFPRPPTRSSFGGSKSFLTLSMPDADRRRSVRLVGRSDSVNDESLLPSRSERTLEDKRRSFLQSFLHNRARASQGSPLWAASIGNHRSAQGSGAEINVQESSRIGRHESQLTSHSKSLSALGQTRSSNRLSQRFRSTFAPNFPRVADDSHRPDDNIMVVNSDDLEEEDNDDWESIANSTSHDLVAEMALPRHQRSWVLPNEASPTPPPTLNSSRHISSSHRPSTPASSSSILRNSKFSKAHLHTATSSRSLSPLVPQSLHSSANAPQSRRSRLSEPIALTSTDSLSHVKGKAASGERPRLAYTKSGRPVSVEDVQRLSSLRAERVVEEEEDVVAGAEGCGHGRVYTDGSGKAFI
ncbi:hypothetical protein Q7P37_009109 [Cladosporium fusiforme]